jgi:competence ComEA-like helix-hairpin-helix protein
MWKDRRNKNFSDSSHDSSALEPLYGLLVIGLFVIFVELIAGGVNGLFPGSKSPKSETSRCVYQVFEDDFCLGTLILEGPETIGVILAALGKNLDCQHKWESEKIPCDRTIKFFSQPVSKTVTKISGAHLLIMGKPIDLNVADQTDLDSVPGIGPELARRIITYRENHGPFNQMVDLERITGIGKKRKDALAVYLTTGQSN